MPNTCTSSQKSKSLYKLKFILKSISKLCFLFFFSIIYLYFFLHRKMCIIFIMWKYTFKKVRCCYCMLCKFLVYRNIVCFKLHMCFICWSLNVFIMLYFLLHWLAFNLFVRLHTFFLKLRKETICSSNNFLSVNFYCSNF